MSTMLTSTSALGNSAQVNGRTESQTAHTRQRTMLMLLTSAVSLLQLQISDHSTKVNRQHSLMILSTLRVAQTLTLHIASGQEKLELLTAILSVLSLKMHGTPMLQVDLDSEEMQCSRTGIHSLYSRQTLQKIWHLHSMHSRILFRTFRLQSEIG